MTTHVYAYSKATSGNRHRSDVEYKNGGLVGDQAVVASADDPALAAAAATAGSTAYLQTEDGGASAADTDGVAGGDLHVTAGDGAAGGAHTANNPDGGNGGDINLSAGSGGAAGSGGSGVAGDPGKVKVNTGLVHFANAQVIDMADAQVALTLNPGTPTGTLLTSNVLFVDPNSAGANEDLLLPPEADCNGLVLFIFNTGGEGILVKEDGDSSTIATLLTAEHCIVGCNGTAWRGMVGAET